ATHAIFVRENAEQANLGVDEVPKAIHSRLVSLRLFDDNHMMVDADVISGDALSDLITKSFKDPKIAYGHIHYAKPGCFAGSVHRVEQPPHSSMALSSSSRGMESVE
ncbi:MAG: DUF1203 domain-containing protein, partial [Pseudomonadota bacterium]